MRPILAIGATGAALAAAAVLGTGSSAGSAASATGGTASLAPIGAGAFFVVDTDQASAQWRSAGTLFGNIPGGQKTLDSALSQLVGVKGLDVTKDVAPALGKQVLVVVPHGAKDPILLVQPGDPKKLSALLAKSKKPEVTGNVSGWTAIAITKKALDAYKAALAKGTLSGDAAYTRAMASVPPGAALVRGYLDGAGLPAALGSLTSAGASITGGITVPSSGNALKGLGTVGVAISFSAGELRVEGSTAATSSAKTMSFAPTLLAGVPADSLVAVSFDGAGGGQSAIDQVLKQGGAQVAALQKQLGVSLADLTTALEGEGVLYVRAGSPIPEVTLAVKPKDAARAEKTFAALAAKLGSSKGSALPVKGIRLVSTVSHGIVFVSTAKGAAADFTGHGAKLTASGSFRQVEKEIGFSGKTNGLGYVDVHALGPLLKTALGALGGSGSTTTGLEGLSAFGVAAFNATSDGSRTRFAAVVTVG